MYVPHKKTVRKRIGLVFDACAFEAYAVRKKIVYSSSMLLYYSGISGVHMLYDKKKQ